ncbi:MAG: UvrB/UvrC motif-containing protein [Verrucomicrobiota bacterium]
MNLDLNTLLEGWPHEPGQIRVRKIRGSDGTEKIQLRLDLGLIQMESAGRPDGSHPHGSASLLDWHRERAEEAEAAGESYTLSADDCNELHQEGIQYYHRYIALFQLEDFPGVLRDTQHNLDLFALVADYAEREELAWSFEQFRPYVLMMRTRAKASLELERDDIPAALRQIERGRDKIIALLQERPEPTETCSEVEFLNEWMAELQSKRPLSKLEILQREMERAVATEAYERAAELRDAIRSFREEK